MKMPPDRSRSILMSVSSEPLPAPVYSVLSRVLVMVDSISLTTRSASQVTTQKAKSWTLRC